MSISTAPVESSTHHASSPHSRRSLFSTNKTDSTQDDLGPISPLNFESGIDQDDLRVIISRQNVKLAAGDYDIFGVVTNGNLPSTPQRKDTQIECMSPLYLSPYCNGVTKISNETPLKGSPSYRLKTPHVQNTNSDLPKLSRKCLSDSSDLSSKRKLSPDKSPEQTKQAKLDTKSRVRTTLFPEEDFALPTKSFYPKREVSLEKIMNKPVVSSNRPMFSTSKRPVFAVTKRKSFKRRRVGQINAGVSHSIRKPKAKMISKANVNSVAKNVVNSAVTNYILDLKELKDQQTTKLIDNKENCNPVIETESQKESVNYTTQSIQPLKLITPAIKPEIEQSLPRKRSAPSNTDLNPNKKFFKSSKAKGIVKMNKNIHLEVDHGKISLIDKKESQSNHTFDMSDLNVEEELSDTNIDSILSCLEDDEQTLVAETNKITLQVTNSIINSDNSVILHEPRQPADTILSPISQMCDVTSGLALNSPKRSRNLTPILEEIHTPSKQEKMFPIFYSGHAGVDVKKKKSVSLVQKKFKTLSRTQTLLDAGQKQFGLTQCHECQFVYHMGDADDDMMHMDYHTGRQVMKFSGWKHERVVAELENNDRIIQIIPGDSKIWWKKIYAVLEVVNRELGHYEMPSALENSQVFLYIKNKTIIGCLSATYKTKGYELITPIEQDADRCSEIAHPIKCGVELVWVSPENRRSSIATCMMNSLRQKFLAANPLLITDIAFGTPTMLGKKFARSYFRSDNFYLYLD